MGLTRIKALPDRLRHIVWLPTPWVRLQLVHWGASTPSVTTTIQMRGPSTRATQSSIAGSAWIISAYVHPQLAARLLSIRPSGLAFLETSAPGLEYELDHASLEALRRRGDVYLLDWASRFLHGFLHPYEMQLVREAADPALDMLHLSGLASRQASLATQAQNYRRSRAAWGIGPTDLRRIMRLQTVLATLGSTIHRGPSSHQSLARSLGFSDAAHLSREVLRMTSFRRRDLFSTGRSGLPSEPSEEVVAVASNVEAIFQSASESSLETR